MENKVVKVALCSARHTMPEDVVGAIFDCEVKMDTEELFARAYNFIKREFGEARVTCYPRRYPVSYVEYTDVEFVETPGKLIVYVTGFTPALIAVVNACRQLGLSDLVLMHYDRDTGDYLKQEVVW